MKTLFLLLSIFTMTFLGLGQVYEFEIKSTHDFKSSLETPDFNTICRNITKENLDTIKMDKSHIFMHINKYKIDLDNKILTKADKVVIGGEYVLDTFPITNVEKIGDVLLITLITESVYDINRKITGYLAYNTKPDENEIPKVIMYYVEFGKIEGVVTTFNPWNIIE